MEDMLFGFDLEALTSHEELFLTHIEFYSQKTRHRSSLELTNEQLIKGICAFYEAIDK